MMQNNPHRLFTSSNSRTSSFLVNDQNLKYCAEGYSIGMGGGPEVGESGENEALYSDQYSGADESSVSEEVPTSQPHVGMCFDSKDAAKAWYSEYGRQVGFTVRVGRAERSRKDQRILSWQFVCSREGFRRRKLANTEDSEVVELPSTRTGCKAMMMIKNAGSQNWVVTRFEKAHNHELEVLDKRSQPLRNLIYRGEASHETIVEKPRRGLRFESKEAALSWYGDYARGMGFSVRVHKNRRVETTNEVVAWIFVCSREGFRRQKCVKGEGKVSRKRPSSRQGCKAMIMLKRRAQNKWILTKFDLDHNHELEKPPVVSLCSSEN